MFWKTWAELGNSTDIRPYELIPPHSSCFPFSKDFLCGRILHVSWGRTLIRIHCTYFVWYFEWTQNATPDVDSKLFVFLNGKARDVGFYFPLTYRHERTGINVHFLILYKPNSFTVAFNTFNFSWPHLNGRQNNSCPVLELLCCLQVENFQGLLIKLLLPLFAECAVLPVRASTISSYLFSRPTMSSHFVFTRLNVKVIFFLGNTMKTRGSV